MFGFGFLSTIHLALAGTGHLIWHWGLGIGLIILCLLGAWFTTAIPLIGPYLQNTRKDFLWAAFGIAVFLAGHTVGVYDEKARCEARSIVIEHTVERAVEKAKTKPRKRGIFQRKGDKKTSDPWDSQEN